MAGVLITVIVLGLIASFSPVIVAACATQLTRPSPRSRGITVLSGVATATAILELMALGLLAGLMALVAEGNDRGLRVAFDLVVGALLIFACLRLLRSPPGAQTAAATMPDPIGESAPRRLKRLFVLGFTLMILNARALLLITGAVTQIRALDTRLEVALLLVVLFLVVNLFPAMPVGAFLISPKFAAKVPTITDWTIRRFEPARERAKTAGHWLLTENRTWLEVATFCGGALLVARGISLMVR